MSWPQVMKMIRVGKIYNLISVLDVADKGNYILSSHYNEFMKLDPTKLRNISF